MIERLQIKTRGRGLHEFTGAVHRAVAAAPSASGVMTLFVRHTSCSLLIQENADQSAARDLERWLDRHVPDGAAFYTHTSEGPDDMPAHIRSMLLATSLSVPFEDHVPLLGTWQGVYLFEHRLRGSTREIVLAVG